MLRAIVAVFLCSTAISGGALAQPSQTPPLSAQPAGEPGRPPMPNFPPNGEAQSGRPLDPTSARGPALPRMPVTPGAPIMPGAPGVAGAEELPGMRTPPGAPPGVGARPIPPPVSQPSEQTLSQNASADTTSGSLISSLDSTAPFVQAIDCLLMLFCGFYCLRKNKTARSVALRVMAFACFVSAIILLGFFFAATY